MSEPFVFDRDTLGHAAELRAEGVPWAKTAEQLGTDEPTLRAVVRENRPMWRRLLELARREVAAEAADEAVHFLRHQLRSKNEKVVLSAAGAILRLRMTEMRLAPIRKKAKAASKPGKRKGKSGEELPEVSEEGLYHQ